MRDIAYTWDEVENLGRTDPIFVIYKKVYNMTGFLHPGDDDLVQFWGIDATKAFEKMRNSRRKIAYVGPLHCWGFFLFEKTLTFRQALFARSQLLPPCLRELSKDIPSELVLFAWIFVKLQMVPTQILIKL